MGVPIGSLKSALLFLTMTFITEFPCQQVKHEGHLGLLMKLKREPIIEPAYKMKNFKGGTAVQ
jgi:hypothetical protein